MIYSEFCLPGMFGRPSTLRGKTPTACNSSPDEILFHIISFYSFTRFPTLISMHV
jgi:hypothetical protein